MFVCFVFNDFLAIEHPHYASLSQTHQLGNVVKSV